MSKVYSLKKVQVLPIDIQQAWDFFSTPSNLKLITPPSLGFNIISGHDEESIYAGQLIEYTVKPVFGIPVYWMTEITQVELMKYFIDEQRYGPYSFWHHQHHFKKVDEGVEMTDIVHYKIPFWFFGDVANSLFVAKQLEEIFEYRQQVVAKYLPGKKQ